MYEIEVTWVADDGVWYYSLMEFPGIRAARRWVRNFGDRYYYVSPIMGEYGAQLYKRPAKEVEKAYQTKRQYNKVNMWKLCPF